VFITGRELKSLQIADFRLQIADPQSQARRSWNVTSSI
jgi:hypothetical protein